MRATSIVNALGFSLALLLVSGCGGTTKTITVAAAPLERPALVVQRPDPVRLREVKWVVITPENVDAVLADLSANGQEQVLISLSPKGYENLAVNISDLRAYIEQQNEVIASYDRYYNQ